MKLKILNLTNLVFLLTILGIWLTTAFAIRPILHYHLQQNSFITGIDFFKTFSAYPGGISDYLAEFIAQFFSFNFPGSVLIVAVASLQGFIALRITKLLVGKIKLHYTVFTLILLFGVVVLCNYRYPYYASIRLLFAFVFSWSFCLINNKYPKISYVLWFVLASLLFYIAGGSALFVFALSAVLIFVIANLQRLRLLWLSAFLLFAGFLPYLGYKLMFQTSLTNIYNITLVKPPVMLAYKPEIPLYIYYSLLPLILLAILSFPRLSEPVPKSGARGKKTSGRIAFIKQPQFIDSFQVWGCVIFGFFLFIKYHDPVKKNLIAIEYYAEHEQWNEILKTARQLKDYNQRVNFQVNRAFSHLGQLPDSLFTYPQMLFSKGLFLDATMAGSATMPTSDLYFDLGFMSESQHWAFEAQTLMPNSPRILKRLVMINLVDRKYKLAGEFLNVLDKNLLCRTWVRKYGKYLTDTALVASDKVLEEKRRFTPQKAIVTALTDDCLKLLIQTNRENRMAYDYLLSYYILDSRFPEFLDYLQYYGYYKIKTLPRSWEEALIFNIAQTRIIPEYYSPLIVTDNCIKRYSDFDKKLKHFKNNLQTAKSTLYKDYDDTYWYYFFYLGPNSQRLF